MKIKAFVLHHTATPTGKVGDGSDLVETLARLAKEKSQGRFSHYYHTLIGPGGKVFSPLSWDQVAPHCGIDRGDPIQDPSGVCNQNSIALCCIGNFDQETMPEAQYQSLLKICVHAKEQHPDAFFKLHRDLVATQCPGKNFPFQRLFDELQHRLKNPSRDPAKDIPSGAWFENAVHFCISRNVLSCDSEGRFRPLAPVNRAELAQALMNLIKRING